VLIPESTSAGGAEAPSLALAGKVVLISGVGPGLGRATSMAALRAGANVVLGDLNAVALRAIADQLDPTGARLAHQRTDISSASECRRLVDVAMQRFGRLDALVHVAAMDSVFGGLVDGDMDEFASVIGVNVLGTLELTRAAVPQLAACKTSSVVVVGSTASVRQGMDEGNLAYGASKGALVTAVRHLARELGPSGIRVNTVSPGWKWGPVLERYLQGEADRTGVSLAHAVDDVNAQLALRRMPDDHDVAAVIAFFCSDASRSITGQNLFVDGGEIWH